MALAPAVSRWLFEMFWKGRREDKKDESKEWVIFIVLLLKIPSEEDKHMGNASQPVINMCVIGVFNPVSFLTGIKP